MLESEALTAAGVLLAQNDSDLATLAQTKVEGYTAPNVALGQIMSVNPYGNIGLSTISE